MPLLVGFNLDLFHGESDWPESAGGVADLLRASIRMNRRFLRKNPDFPSPFSRPFRWTFKGRAFHYPNGLRYLVAHANEPTETFRSIPEIVAAGGSDCDGIGPLVVSWRIERENDSQADIFLQWKRGLQPGTLIYHVLEKNGRGDIGDPCRAMGMGR